MLLLLARVGQACAAALVIPNGMALIRNGAPPKKLGAYLGITGALIALSAAIGPAVAPAILTAASWRWIFVSTIPVAAVSLYRGKVPRTVRKRGSRRVLPVRRTRLATWATR